MLTKDILELKSNDITLGESLLDLALIISGYTLEELVNYYQIKEKNKVKVLNKN